MTPEEDKIFGAFLECSLAPLEGVRTYEYMTNLNVYLNLSLSAVNCTLGCGTLGHLVLTAQSAVFNTHCGTEFVTPINPARACGRADTQPVTANGIACARSADKQHITTNHIELPILQVSLIISNDAHRQWRYTS